MKQAEITALLKKEMVPALGCTGPTAYALATACCRPFLTSAPKEIKVYVSPAFLKIGFGVATPGTSRPGIEIAAALGLVGGNYKLGLQVLSACTSKDVEAAQKLADSGIIRVLCAENETGVYVRAEVYTDDQKVIAIVEHTHDGVSLIEVNGIKKFEAKHTAEHENLEDNPDQLSLEDIFTYIKSVNPADIRFLMDGYHMNVLLAEDGIKQRFGLGIGYAFLDQWWRKKGKPEDLFVHPLNYLPDNVLERSKILVAGASDARMGGSRLPALAAMGDGNQGITATLPVGVTSEIMKKDENETIRALALSCLMLFYVKMHIGRTSAFCLCAIAASAGIAAGCSYLRGMNEKQIRAAVKNVISPLCGMLCDGAKNACSLKMVIATNTALSCVDLTIAGVECGFYDGVADDTLEHTVSCITGIATSVMDMLDKCMVDKIIKKTDRKRLEATQA